MFSIAFKHYISIIILAGWLMVVERNVKYRTNEKYLFTDLSAAIHRLKYARWRDTGGLFRGLSHPIRGLSDRRFTARATYRNNRYKQKRFYFFLLYYIKICFWIVQITRAWDRVRGAAYKLSYKIKKRYTSRVHSKYMTITIEF